MNGKDRFIPIGSVVLLKDAKVKVMIIGFAAVEHGKNKIWDYIGCAYPIGVVNSENNLLFDADKIDKVIALGYSDEEDKTFRKGLEVNLEVLKK